MAQRILTRYGFVVYSFFVGQYKMLCYLLNFLVLFLFFFFFAQQLFIKMKIWELLHICPSSYKLRSEYIDLFLKPHLGDAGRRSLILINIHVIYLLSVNSVNWCCCAKICLKIPWTASFALHANELPYKSRVYMVWPELIARGVSFLCRAKNNCASVEEYLWDYVNIYTRPTRQLF